MRDMVAALHSGGEKALCISLIIPIFNEKDVLSVFLERIEAVFAQSSQVTLEIFFVNDGSSNGTLAYLLKRQARDPRMPVVDFSRGLGKKRP